ncbi:MarR family transcriptional regulator [Microbacterium sp. VKM Ac-2870]|uniref:MarR family winged helix-turn-helix transcriptional regulator n=1 Tax=Microbacterium sp. VKM Ac-2870 TaxID=2783825 RepID=UPI00188C6FE2|nr:MarR family transcriptional regulator [Microbacterium sp. VKM Ac-2870]MBF4562326.1 MarR family transcriptional regulator [Microbacterium sp. VKM Ac-2870]
MSAPTTLDEFVCFAMYTASHATTQAYREVLKPWKLTYPQYLAIVVLAAGERTVSGLGDELGLDSGTLSPLLRRLEDRGLVGRRRDAGDERIVRVELTPAGREVHDAVIAAAGCLVPAFVDSGRNLGELLEQLSAITANMRALAADLRAAA